MVSTIGAILGDIEGEEEEEEEDAVSAEGTSARIEDDDAKDRKEVELEGLIDLFDPYF